MQWSVLSRLFLYLELSLILNSCSSFKITLKTLQFFAACLLSASSRGEGYYEKEAGGVEKAQDVNSNEVIWNQRVDVKRWCCVQ